MTWRRDTRPENVRTFGDFKVFSEVNSDRETAHVVQFPDGREIRVLPDHRGGAARSKLVRQATETTAGVADRLEANLAALVLKGALTSDGLEWEYVVTEVTVEEWLSEWFGGGPGGEEEASRLLHALDEDFYEIVRKGEE